MNFGRARPAVLFLLLLGVMLDRAEAVDVDKIVQEIDELFRSESSHGLMEMEIITPHWERTLRMEVWTEGMKKTFIRIQEPAKERGVATLRIGDEMWNYLPKTNKVIKIPPSMMMSSWMGSDFTNDDLVKEFTLFEDYSYEEIRPTEAKPSLIYVNCIPREDLPVVWGKVVIAVDRESHLPVWQRYIDEQDELMRTLYYEDVTTFDKRTLPATMKMVPEDEEGNQTVIRYLDLEFNIPVSEEIFSLRNLRSTR